MFLLAIAVEVRWAIDAASAMQALLQVSISAVPPKARLQSVAVDPGSGIVSYQQYDCCVLFGIDRDFSSLRQLACLLHLSVCSKPSWATLFTWPAIAMVNAAPAPPFASIQVALQPQCKLPDLHHLF